MISGNRSNGAVHRGSAKKSALGSPNSFLLRRSRAGDRKTNSLKVEKCQAPVPKKNPERNRQNVKPKTDKSLFGFDPSSGERVNHKGKDSDTKILEQ